MYTIISSSFPDASELSLATEYDVDVYRITYKSYMKDSLINASGLVCVPRSEGEYSFISFQNGTITEDSNAPSIDISNMSYRLVQSMAGIGYIMLLPDYFGFGASEQMIHPYHHRESSDKAVFDMIRAAEEFIANAQLTSTFNGKTYLMGYSQGGWASMSALSFYEHSTGVSDIDITAVSCGAGAYDLNGMWEYVFEKEYYSGALYLPYFIYTQKAYGFLQNDLSLFFNEPYSSDIPGLFDGSKSFSEISLQLTDNINELLNPDLILGFTGNPAFAGLRTVMTANSIPAWNLNTPLSLYHGTEDETVPPFQSTEMFANLLSAGTSAGLINHFELEGMDHGEGVVPWGLKTILWFNSFENN